MQTIQEKLSQLKEEAYRKKTQLALLRWRERNFTRIRNDLLQDEKSIADLHDYCENLHNAIK